MLQLSISQIRSLTTISDNVFYTTDKGQEGLWQYDPLASSSLVDNTGTILKTAGNQIIRRNVNGAVNVKWFGAKGDYDISTQSGIPDTEAFQAAIRSGHSVLVPEGNYLITEVELSYTERLFGEGAYVTNIFIKYNPSQEYRGLYYEIPSSEGETSMVVSDLRIEAEKYATVGFHSSGVTIGNVAHAYFENIHCIGFKKGFYIKDSLINTFIRCRANANIWGVYIDGTEFGQGGPGASKNLFTDLKCTNNGDVSHGGGAICITGVSSYQNVFLNPDLELNYRAVSIDGTDEIPHVFIAPYFECSSGNPNKVNLITLKGKSRVIMQSPGFGNTNGSATGFFFDSQNTGTVEIISAMSNTQAARILVPKKGKMELIGYNGHDVASTDIMSAIDYKKMYVPVMQNAGLITGSSLSSFIYGESSAGIVNTFEVNPNVPSNWSDGTGETGKTDPIGELTAVKPTSNFSMRRAIGAATGKVVAQVFIKVITDDISEFQLAYVNNTVVRATRIYSFSGKSEWMLIHVDFDLTGASSISNLHEIRLLDCSNKIHVWFPQIIQGTSIPQPVLPLDSSSDKLSIGQGIGASFNKPIRKVGIVDYELPKIVRRVKYVGVASTSAQFIPLVGSGEGIKVFELIIREVFGGFAIASVYHVAMSYDGACTTNSIKKISEMGGLPPRSIPSISSLAVNTVKTIILTNTDYSDVNATIREIT